MRVISIDALMTAINKQVLGAINNMAPNYREAEVEYHSILKDRTKLEQIFIRSGIPRRDIAPINNVPSGFRAKNLDLVLIDAEIPTTISWWYDFFNKNNCITEAQVTGILNSYHVKDYYTKTQQWINSVNADILTMKKNLEILPVYTQEENDFCNSLYNFDWYYDYSDDGNVARGGHEHHKKIKEKHTEMIKENPKLKDVVTLVGHVSGFGSLFFYNEVK
jgi:hypothetical protein